MQKFKVQTDFQIRGRFFIFTFSFLLASASYFGIALAELAITLNLMDLV